MSQTILIAIGVLDVLVFAFLIYLLRQKQVGESADLVELNYERQQIASLIQSSEEKAVSIREECRGLLNEMLKKASEIDLELKSQAKGLNGSMETLGQEITSHLDQPLSLVAEEKKSLERMLSKTRLAQQKLSKLIQRGEQVSKFFSGLPYDQVLQDVENKKYADARSLIAKGLSASEIARAVGLPLAEVKTLQGIAQS